MNENTEYELLTMRIYQLLLKKQGFNTIEVKHNIKVKGKSNVEHQIDVFWEFKMADIPHMVAIECKNYNSNISLSRIRDFHSVLQDIGNVSGILVTKAGFQSGVIAYAKHHGIGLKLLRNPIEEDWDGKLKKIEFNIHTIVPQIKSRKINIDEEWFKSNIEKDKWNLPFSINGMSNEIWILDKNGNKYKSILDLEQGVPTNWITEFDLIHTYEFAENYIEVNLLGMLKLRDIVFQYDVLTGEGVKIMIDAEKIVDKILRDILTNEIKFIHKDGEVR